MTNEYSFLDGTSESVSHRMPPPLWRRLLLPLMIVAWSIGPGPSPLSAQNIQHTENKPDLSLRSEIRVDPSTLGMSFSIPLASYSGRAGHGLPVIITYNSKVLRLAFQGVDSTPVTGAKTWTGVEFAEHSTAGWTSTLNPPRVEFTGMGQFFDWQGHAACPDVCLPGQTIVGDHYIKRIHVHMPDGSSHELRLDDQLHNSPVEPFTGTFQAVDGSRMRYESNAGTVSVLYLPDGSRYLFGPYNIGNELTATHFIDRNGNTLTYNASTRQWTDTLNRVITNPLPATPAANTETYFLAKLIGGIDATYTFRWKYLADVLTPDPVTGQPPQLRYPGNNKCAHNSYPTVSPSLFTSSSDTKVCVEQDQFGNPLLFNPVVLAEVVLPTGKFYRFTYTVYGEIDKILLTTGATDRFAYNQVATLSSSSGPYSQTNRGVIERRVSATGSGTDESLWTYAVISTNPYTVRTTRPDLSYSERLLHRSRYTGLGENFARFEFDDARMGMAYEERSYNSSGIMLRRELSKWIESGPLAGGYSTAARDPKVTKQVSIILDGPGSNALTATKVNRYEQASQPLNLTSTTEYGYDTSMSKTTAQSAGVDSFNPADSLAIRTNEIAYLDNLDYVARNLTSLPISVTTKSGMPVSGQVTARSEMLYDEALFAPLICGATAGWSDPGTISRANITTVKSWLNTLGAVTNQNAYLATHTQYDQCGSVRKIWDARDTPLNNPTQIEYSHQFSYPTLNTSPDPDGSGPLLSLTTSTEYDVSTGLVTATVDANGQRTTFSYNDPLNRLTQVARATTDAVAKNQSTFSYDDNARTITATSDLNAYEDNLLKTVTIYDGLGRGIETQTFEGGTNYTATQQQYDTLGRVFKTSNPLRPWQSETPVWTTTTYDALSRVLTVTTPDNAVVTTNYSGNTVTVTDQAQKKRKSVTDALGRLIEVYEDPDVPGGPTELNYQTLYMYDVLDNLVKVTQGAQQRFFMYDSLKRLIRARNPELGTLGSLAFSDPATGNSAWSIGYQYDANGNLTDKTDARGVVSTYTYDALNRNTTVNFSDTTITPDVKRFYDGATNGKGRFWYFYSGGDFSTGANVDHTAVDSYDALGRPLVQRQLFKLNNVWGPTYQTSRSYNRAGGVWSQKYPSEHGVTYNYDAAGRVGDKDALNLAFTGNLGDGVLRIYAKEVKYSSWGSLSREQFGTSTAVYHKLRYNIRGQLCDVRASNVNDDMGGELGALVNHYSTNWAYCGSGSDNNGNVLMNQTIINSVWFEDRYAYDALNRLTSVSEYLNGSTPSGSQQYNYDRWGNRNITSSSPALGFNTSLEKEDATNRLYAPGDLALADESRRIRYDKAGNQIKDTFTGYGMANFDAENHITSIQDSLGGWSTYTYNADGQRTRRKINNQETWQIYGFDGELLAEYAASSSAASPQKEYGYRNGQLFITASASNGAAGLVGYWKLDENTGTTTVDSSGTGNTGTLSSGASWVLGQSGSATNLDGANDYVQVGAQNSLVMTSAASFSGWIYPTGPGSHVPEGGIIVNKEGEYELARFQDGTIRCAFANTNPGWNWINTGYVAPLNQWTHVAVVYASGVVKTYINGVLTHTHSGSGTIGDINPTQNDFRIGGRQGASQYFQGRIDEVRVYNRALAASEITTLLSSSGSQINWLVSDHLGTPRMIIDQTGSLATVKRHDYLPFGEELLAGTGGRTTAQGYSAADGVRQQFTQNERDIETGLDYFQARYYSSVPGRFSSVDPLVAAPHLNGAMKRPQAWNAYSYALNNPEKYLDPNGMRWAMRKLANGSTEYGWFDTDEAYYAAIDSSSETYQGWTAVNFDETQPFTIVTRSLHGDGLFCPCFTLELAQLNPDGEIESGIVNFSLDDILVDLGTQKLFGKSWLEGKRSFDTTIAKFINGLPSLPLAAGTFPSKPPTPNNMPQQEFGKQVMKWGTGDEAARARMATLTREELQRAGVTKEIAAQWRDFYREVTRVTPANPSAAGRADLMQRAVELLSK